MGGVAARLLAARDDVDLLVLDADEARARSVVADTGKGEARAVDIGSAGLADALKEVQAVAACIPYRLNLPVMEAALAAGCHYADLGGLFHTTLEQLEYDQRFRDAGLSAVLGIGSAPGLTNVLAKLGADRLDEIDSIDMVDGAVEEGGGFGVPYSADTVLDEFTLPAMVFEGGEMKEVPAGSGAIEWEFPEPLGKLTAVHTLHSEPATLPTTIPGVKDVLWRLALPKAVHEGFGLLADIGLASDEPLETPAGNAVPRQVLLALLAKLPQPEGPSTGVEVLDVRVRGRKQGRAATVLSRATFLPQPDGTDSGSFGTALPITVAARWQAEGRVSSGVHPPETAFDPLAFVLDLTAAGVRLTTSLEEDLSSG